MAGCWPAKNLFRAAQGACPLNTVPPQSRGQMDLRSVHGAACGSAKPCAGLLGRHAAHCSHAGGLGMGLCPAHAAPSPGILWVIMAPVQQNFMLACLVCWLRSPQQLLIMGHSLITRRNDPKQLRADRSSARHRPCCAYLHCRLCWAPSPTWWPADTDLHNLSVYITKSITTVVCPGAAGARGLAQRPDGEAAQKLQTGRSTAVLQPLPRLGCAGALLCPLCGHPAAQHWPPRLQL